MVGLPTLCRIDCFQGSFFNEKKKKNLNCKGLARIRAFMIYLYTKYTLFWVGTGPNSGGFIACVDLISLPFELCLLIWCLYNTITCIVFITLYFIPILHTFVIVCIHLVYYMYLIVFSSLNKLNLSSSFWWHQFSFCIL